jgi:hypothetical protein
MRRLGFAFSCALAGLVFCSVSVPANFAPDDASVLGLKPALPAEDVNPPVAPPEAPAVKDDSDEPKEPVKPTSLERAKAALAESDAPVLSNDEVCTTLVEVARANALPVGFFTNLIWRESRFDHVAISRVGAMGIAQFMPDVAAAMRLDDAFDAREALPASGRLLRTLRARFANLGLIAAAYNAGPKRVLDWLAARANLPKETRDYVNLITGRSVEEWRNAKAKTVVFDVPRQVPCHRIPTFSSVEQAERAAQALKLAEEKRIEQKRAMELSARKASLRQRKAGAAKSRAAHQRRLGKVAQSKAR